MCLRAGVIGSIRAWLPSRRSVDSQRGARGDRLRRPGAVGQVDRREGAVAAERHRAGLLDRYRLRPGAGAGNGGGHRRSSLVRVGWAGRAPNSAARGPTRLAGLAAAAKEEQTTSHGLTITQIAEPDQPEGKPMAGRRAVRHPGGCLCVPVSPDDPAQVAALVEILNAAQRVDDPEAFDWLPEAAADELRYGWDLQPEEHFLYVPDGADGPVAALAVDLPKRDNLASVLAADRGPSRPSAAGPRHGDDDRGAAGWPSRRAATRVGRGGGGRSRRAQVRRAASASATPATTPGGGSCWPTSTRTTSPGCSRRRRRAAADYVWSGCCRRCPTRSCSRWSR